MTYFSNKYELENDCASVFVLMTALLFRMLPNLMSIDAGKIKLQPTEIMYSVLPHVWFHVLTVCSCELVTS